MCICYKVVGVVCVCPFGVLCYKGVCPYGGCGYVCDKGICVLMKFSCVWRLRGLKSFGHKARYKSRYTGYLGCEGGLCLIVLVFECSRCMSRCYLFLRGEFGSGLNHWGYV